VSEELRILILEDQPTDAELMQCEVRKEGIAFSARRVETEADFRKQLREFRPGLILADYKLPSYDGMSALATVQEEYAEAPFILVSGTVGEEIAIDALQHGATDYVLKQRLSRLGPSVRRALREAQERRERQRAEAAVQRERRHLNEILEALPVMICLLTPDYQVPLANRRFRENFGESQGRRCFEYIFHRTEPCPECQSFTPLKTHAPHHWEWAAPNGRHLDIYDLPFTDANGSPLILEMAIDITERKRAEEALRASERRFQELFDGAPIGYHELDTSGRIIRVNRTEAAMLGYSVEEMLGRVVCDFVVEREECRKTLLAKLSGVEPAGRQLERTYRWKDGTLLPVLIEDRVLLDAAGRITGIRSTLQDITERKQAERELAESEKRYRTLFDDSLEAMSVTIAGRIWDANDAWLRMHGFSDKKEVVGLDVMEMIHPEDRGTLAQRRKIPPGERARLFQVRDVRKDGTTVDVECYSCAISLGGDLLIVTTVRDVTNRKRAEQQREQALRREEGIAVLLQSLIARGALDGKLGMVTDAIVRLFEADFCRIWLIGPGDLCQRGCTHAQVTEGPHVCRNRKRCLRLAASSGRYTRLDGGHRRVPFGCYKIGRVASGEEHRFLTNDVPNDPRVHNHEWARDLGLVSFAGYQLRVPGGETLGVLALFARHLISSDEDAMLDGLGSTVALVIQQAAADEEIRRLNEDLERRVSERTAELQAANKELESFAYSISHDLRAPLRAINGFSQMLLEDCADKLDEQGKEHLHRIRAASTRMGDLIDDILEISRVARQEIKRVEVDMSNLADQIGGELQTADPRREVELVVGPGLKADGDPLLLRLVLQNLMQNAWKFTVKTPAARIELGSMQREGKTVYFVRDNGAGFDMAYVGKLFGAFQRLHSPKEFPGTGIGLATVQRIIHRHGGMAWAEGEVGKGATFYFTL
jgi:PAS domain S-box-containing protein